MMAETAAHPEHAAMKEHGGLWFPAQPLGARGLLGWQMRRACRRSGGHWWHPEVASMIGWFCCACGAVRDGGPRDGT